MDIQRTRVAKIEQDGKHYKEGTSYRIPIVFTLEDGQEVFSHVVGNRLKDAKESLQRHIEQATEYYVEVKNNMVIKSRHIGPSAHRNF